MPSESVQTKQMSAAEALAWLEAQPSSQQESHSPPLSKMREELWRKMGGRRLAVHLDTTTYLNAISALRGKPTACSLLDLSLLTVAATCFDEIVILPHLLAPQSPVLSKFTRVVDVTPKDKQALIGLYWSVLHTCEDREIPYGQRWAEFRSR